MLLRGWSVFGTGLGEGAGWKGYWAGRSEGRWCEVMGSGKWFGCMYLFLFLLSVLAGDIATKGEFYDSKTTTRLLL